MTTLTAAIYCRISRDAEAKGLGVARQEQDCRELAAAKGWAVEGVYTDNDISATRKAGKVKERPAYQAMVDGIRAGRVGAVVAWELDRLGRDPFELEHFWLECEQHGVLVATRGDNVDAATGEGVMYARIKAAVAAEEAKRIRDRTRRKHEELAENGLPKGGGRRGLGYEPDGMTIREDEAAMIRDAAQRVLIGEPLSSIAKSLGWQITTLRKVLLAPRIAGLRAHRGEVVGRAAWPAIVDEESWERVRRVLSDPHRRGVGGRTRLGSRLLSGMVRCGRCGDKMTLATVHRRDGLYYRCRRTRAAGCGGLSTKADELEELIGRVIVGVTKRMEPVHEPQDAGLDAIAAELDKDRLRLERLEDALIDGDVSRASYRRRRAELEERIEAAEEQLARAAEARYARPWTAEEIEAAWGTAPLATKRAAVRSVLEKVIVRPAEVRGRNTFDPERVAVVDRQGREHEAWVFAMVEELL